ncbi:single-stranded DNA-binding protein [Fimbriiglobus ruber]|uniref:Single-stranded DNA-binding protein n=1 Tax=Fimbriiglobus ruber TaxID=1908690 RepID=A0A225DDH5_9BACT|nr:single-stranded DNA-binding protein [Fimbriiglobus ruber]OWK39522.1 Single-stranded DNA-binding protein [Fimbriiglobus ruber]
MAGSINEATLLGNLGKDPEVRKTQDGKEIVTLSVATSESWREKSTGDRKERVEWHRVVIFNDALAGIARDFLRKGSKVYLRGQIQSRKWVDQSGQEKYATEVVLQGFGAMLVLLDPKKDDSPDRQTQAGGMSQPSGAFTDDSEIPF